MIRTDFSVKIISATRPHEEARNGLITVQMSLARDIWTEVLTHRLAARNASSRRAMSGKRIMETHGAWMPPVFYRRAKGMGDDNTPLSEDTQYLARLSWKRAIKAIEDEILYLESIEVCKQQANRLLTGAHITNGVVTMTEGGWAYFLGLRNHEDADRAMRELLAAPLQEMIDGLDASELSMLQDQIGDSLAGTKWKINDYHLPFWPDDLPPGWSAYNFDERRLIAVARIARVSYGEVRAAADDLALARRLIASRHASPFEHLAHCFIDAKPSALNCLPCDRYKQKGWQTFRAELGF